MEHPPWRPSPPAHLLRAPASPASAFVWLLALGLIGGLPDDPAEIENLSWARMRVLAARYSAELEGNGAAHERGVHR
jgi:hypothetical protein